MYPLQNQLYIEFLTGTKIIFTSETGTSLHA